MSDVGAGVAVGRGGSVERAIGLAGVVGLLLVLVPVIVSSSGEPPLDSTADEATQFLRGLDQWWAVPARGVSHLGMMVLLGFMVGLALVLRRAEGPLPVRSTVAIVSAALLAAYLVLDASEQAAVHRSNDLDQRQLALAYDLGHFSFVNVWLPMGTFAVTCGWLIVSTRALPRWLGWWAVVGGTCLALAPLAPLQVAWPVGQAFLLPYYAWLLTAAGLLIGRRRRPSPDRDHRAAVTGSTR